jgi:hypothetical protein
MFTAVTLWSSSWIQQSCNLSLSSASKEAPSTGLSEDHLGEVQEKVQEQVQLLDLFEARHPEQKEELGEDATAVHLQKHSVL